MVYLDWILLHPWDSFVLMIIFALPLMLMASGMLPWFLRLSWQFLCRYLKFLSKRHSETYLICYSALGCWLFYLFDVESFIWLLFLLQSLLVQFKSSFNQFIISFRPCSNKWSWFLQKNFVHVFTVDIINLISVGVTPWSSIRW